MVLILKDNIIYFLYLNNGIRNRNCIKLLIKLLRCKGKSFFSRENIFYCIFRYIRIREVVVFVFKNLV